MCHTFLGMWWHNLPSCQLGSFLPQAPYPVLSAKCQFLSLCRVNFLLSMSILPSLDWAKRSIQKCWSYQSACSSPLPWDPLQSHKKRPTAASLNRPIQKSPIRMNRLGVDHAPFSLKGKRRAEVRNFIFIRNLSRDHAQIHLHRSQTMFLAISGHLNHHKTSLLPETLLELFYILQNPPDLCSFNDVIMLC